MISSRSHFYNETDLEQYLFNVFYCFWTRPFNQRLKIFWYYLLSIAIPSLDQTLISALCLDASSKFNGQELDLEEFC